MNEIKLSRTVNAPAAVVWATITDMDAWTTVISGITSVERLDDGTTFDVGTSWRETRTMFGKEATEDMAVTELVEGESYVVEADSNGAHYRSVFTVEADGNDVSTIRMTFAGEPKGVVSQVMAATIGRLFMPATRKVMQVDLDELAAAAEARVS